MNAAAGNAFAKRIVKARRQVFTKNPRRVGPVAFLAFVAFLASIARCRSCADSDRGHSASAQELAQRIHFPQRYLERWDAAAPVAGLLHI